MKIYISTGELSGDIIASKLVNELQQKNPDIQVNAMGGQHLKDAGANIIVDIEHLSVHGVWEVIVQFKAIRRAFKDVVTHLKATKPDLVILVDYSGFNLRLAKVAKSLGIKTLYYVSPQIWASRYGRVKKIKQYIDHMAVLFQFEEGIYRKEQIPVTFVGHPLADNAKPMITKEQAYSTFNMNPEHPVIALLPGSRRNEIIKLMPSIIDACALIKKTIPNAQFIMPLANSISDELIQPYLQNHKITVVRNQLYNALSICDAAIAVSGTITLEVALQQVPLVIIYRVNWLTAAVFKLAINTPYIGLCNIIAQEKVAQELLQFQATPKLIAKETLRLLNDQAYRQTIKQKLSTIPAKLGSSNGAQKAAQVVQDLLQGIDADATSS